MIKDDPLVSVAIVTYNQKIFLKECIESVLAQEYKNIQIVVADDCSTDGSQELLIKYSIEHPGKFVLLLSEFNLGITKNCNSALQSCSGKYVSFLGGDDVMLPGKISKQVEWLEKDEMRTLCGHQVEVFYEDGTPSHNLTRFLKKGRGPKEFIKHGALFGAVSVMIRRECIPSWGFELSLSLVSDGFLYIETLINGGKYGYIKGVYAKYRRHNANITNQWHRCVDDLSKSLKLVRERYPKFKRAADIGEANLIHYGHGLKCLKEGKIMLAMPYFVEAIKRNPFGWRIWFRIVQASSMIFINVAPGRNK